MNWYYQIDLLRVRLLEYSLFVYCQSLSTKLIGQHKTSIPFAFLHQTLKRSGSLGLLVNVKKFGFQLTERTSHLLRI